MPHFIIECSNNIMQQSSCSQLVQIVYDTALKTGLFMENDIKVRLQLYDHFQLGKNKNGFIHVFAHIMEGRTTAQKAMLSKTVVENLNQLLPDLSIISMNIYEFELATYSNKSMIHPDNIEGNRFF